MVKHVFTVIRQRIIATMAAVALNIAAAQQQCQEEEIRERILQETEEEKYDKASGSDLEDVQYWPAETTI